MMFVVGVVALLLILGVGGVVTICAMDEGDLPIWDKEETAGDLSLLDAMKDISAECRRRTERNGCNGCTFQCLDGTREFCCLEGYPADWDLSEFVDLQVEEVQ